MKKSEAKNLVTLFLLNSLLSAGIYAQKRGKPDKKSSKIQRRALLLLFIIIVPTFLKSERGSVKEIKWHYSTLICLLE